MTGMGLTTIAISCNRLDAALICIIIHMAHLIKIRSFYIFTISKTLSCWFYYNNNCILFTEMFVQESDTVRDMTRSLEPVW